MLNEHDLIDFEIISDKKLLSDVEPNTWVYWGDGDKIFYLADIFQKDFGWSFVSDIKNNMFAISQHDLVTELRKK